MTVSSLVDSLRQHGVELRVVGDVLKVKAPAGVVDADLRRQLQERKPEIMRYLGGIAEVPAVSTPKDPMAAVTGGLATAAIEVIAPNSVPVTTPTAEVAAADAVPKPFKVYDDFPDGRTVVIETEDEWNALVQHFYQLHKLDQRRQTKR